MRDRGEPLHVPADEPADRFRFCLAQCRELLGDVLDRAVVLADLYADAAVVDGRGVAVVAERLGQRRGALIQRQGGDLGGVARLPLSDALPGEVLDRALTRGLAQVA